MALPSMAFLSMALAAAPAAPSAAPALVATGALAADLARPGLVLLDARPSLRDYLTGHIPGAQPLAVENLRSASGGVPGEVFPPAVLSVIAGRLGITASSRVVVYGAENDPDATFVASVLRLHGVRSVAVLEGGLKRWTREGRPVTAGRHAVAPTRLKLAAPAGGIVTAGEVRRELARGGALLIDVRPADQYEAGHIPGALNRFWKLDLAPDGAPDAGAWRDDAALAAEYLALGVAPDRRVIVYCNTGHMASHVFWTLRWRLGYPDVLWYDGSWTEWSMLPGAPVEAGAHTPPR